MKHRVQLGLLATAVACAVVYFLIQTPPEGTAAAPQSQSLASRVPAAANVQPQTVVVAPPPAETLTVASEDRVESPLVDGTKLTAKTLAGTRWQDEAIDVVFMADGQWQMNGRVCAKWIVEGDRVKIFDDKGEVHYVDIVGDSIAFNGKKIGRVPTG